MIRRSSHIITAALETIEHIVQMASDSYHEPVALTIISSISIGIAAIFSAWIAVDIIIRRGWKSMMAIMIPVYIINALYVWPITLWTYLRYSRPEKPKSRSEVEQPFRSSHSSSRTDVNSNPPERAQGNGEKCHGKSGTVGPEGHESSGEHMHHHHRGSDRPVFATVTIGVCHCGAGCVLGDVIGEWIVYATGASIGSPPCGLWVNYLVGKFILLWLTRSL